LDETQIYVSVGQRSETEQEQIEPPVVDEERSIYCSTRCRTCKSCVCVNHGLPCIKDKCQCNTLNCSNAEKRGTYTLWKDTSEQFLDRDFNTNEMEGKTKTDVPSVLETCMLYFKSSGILHHIVEDTRKCKKYRNMNCTSSENKKKKISNSRSSEEDLEEQF